MFTHFWSSLRQLEESALCKAFWIVLTFHVVFWTIGPHFCIPYWFLDVPELIAIGKHWLISSNKHPAFQSWVIEIFTYLFGSVDYAPYVAAQIAVAIPVWCVWRLGKEFLSPQLALIAALSMLTYLFYNYESMQYNNRSFMRAFIALSVYWTWLAFKTNRLRYWILVGFALAGGLYCKLSTFITVFTIVAFMLVDSETRKYWRKPGPYITTGICFLLFLPYLIWLFQHQFASLGYAYEGLQPGEYQFTGHFIYPLVFLGTQLLIISPILLCMTPTLGIGWKWSLERFWGEDAKKRFLTFMTLFPLLLILLIPIITGHRLKARYACLVWLFLPLFLMYTAAKVREDWTAIRRSLVLIISLMILIAGGTILATYYTPKFQDKAARIYYPGPEIAERVTQIWEERIGTPLAYVRGDDWTGIAIEIYGKTGAELYCPLWSDEEDFRKKGGILLWQMPSGKNTFSNVDYFGNVPFHLTEEGNPNPEWFEQFERWIPLEPLEFRALTPFDTPPVRVGIALVPPEDWKESEE